MTLSKLKQQGRPASRAVSAVLKRLSASTALLSVAMSLQAQSLLVKLVDLNSQAVPDAAVALSAVLPTPEDPAAERVEIDQVNEQFIPQMTVVQKGTDVWFPNRDNVRHHVYSFSVTRPFELKLYHANDAPPVNFERTGVVLLGCNIHDSMRAAMLVTEEKVFGVTPNSGEVALSFEVPRNAPLPLQLKVWHEQMGTTEPLIFSVHEEALASGRVSFSLPMYWKPRETSSISDLKSRLKSFKSRSAIP